MPYVFNKVLVLSIICYKFDSNEEKTFKKEKSTEISKILGLINNISNTLNKQFLVPNKYITTF